MFIKYFFYYLNQKKRKSTFKQEISSFLRKLELLFPANRNEDNEYHGDGVNVTVTFLALSSVKTKGRGMHNAKQVHMTKSAYKELIMESQTEAARQTKRS